MIGDLTAFFVSQTSLKVMGLIAGPDNPPVGFPKRDFPERKSMAMAGEGFATVEASAPASSPARAIRKRSATRGGKLTQMDPLQAAVPGAPTTPPFEEG